MRRLPERRSLRAVELLRRPIARVWQGRAGEGQRAGEFDLLTWKLSRGAGIVRIGKNIEYILATFRGAVNLKDIATFRRGGAPYVDQYFGASGRPARPEIFLGFEAARMAVFNDFAPPCMYSMCDRLGWIMGWISLGRILIHIIFLFPMDGTGDGFGRLVHVLRSAYGTAPHPFGGLNFTRAQRRVVKRGEARILFSCSFSLRPMSFS